jgi:hypothetical protein
MAPNADIMINMYDDSDRTTEMLTKDDKAWILEALYTLGSLIVRAMDHDHDPNNTDFYHRHAREEFRELHEQ